MKVLMIVPQPFFQARGTPFSVYFRARTMAALGHEIDIVTYPIGRDVAIPGVRILRTAGVPFIRNIKIGPSLPKLVLDIPLFFKAFRLLARGNYDLVHAHEEAAFFCLVYKIFFRRLRILYDMHSSLPQQLRNFKFSRNPLLIRAFEWLESLSLRNASGIITICPELQRTVDGLHVRVPSVMIENTLFDGVAFAEGGPDAEGPSINWSEYADRKVVLYSGTFEAYQGLPMLIDAIPAVLRRRPDALFVLVGGAPDQVADMRARAASLKVESSVLFTGNLSPNAAKSFIRRADVLVSPRIKGTNTPLKIYEYLASGKPIVATRHPTHTQILTDHEAILSDCDASSFASGIVDALDDANRARGVVAGATSLYQRSYAPEIYRARLQELLGRLSGPVPGGVPAAAVGAR